MSWAVSEADGARRYRGDGPRISSKEMFERIRDLSLGLRGLGISRGDRVAIVSESRPEWLLSDLAVLTASAVTVPIYPTLSAAQARYILQDSGARLAIVSTRLQREKVQEVRHLLPSIEAVVVMDPASAASANSSSVLSLEEVERRGHARMTGVGRRKGFETVRERSSLATSRRSSTPRERPASPRGSC
jgi:long-chain acyl-CoA synthetase